MFGSRTCVFHLNYPHVLIQGFFKNWGGEYGISIGLIYSYIDIILTAAKPESALATQIRTEKIGLVDFLDRQRVPTSTSPAFHAGGIDKRQDISLRSARV